MNNDYDTNLTEVEKRHDYIDNNEWRLRIRSVYPGTSKDFHFITLQEFGYNEKKEQDFEISDPQKMRFIASVFQEILGEDIKPGQVIEDAI